jgi:hypothetical protein
MARMTEEEAFALDEKWTKMDPKVGPNGSGFFTQKRKSALSVTVDDLSAKWLITKATSSSKTPADIVGELVREKIAVGV